jgi:hypothetical protein
MGGAAGQAGDAQRNNHSPSNGLHSFIFRSGNYLDLD